MKFLNNSWPDPLNELEISGTDPLSELYISGHLRQTARGRLHSSSSNIRAGSTGWQVKHGRVLQVPCIKWLVKCTLSTVHWTSHFLQSIPEKHGHVYLVGLSNFVTQCDAIRSQHFGRWRRRFFLHFVDSGETPCKSMYEYMYKIGHSLYF